ncbi:MAG: NADP-dependent oxidoreductase [Pseudomonadota bacterium]
MSQRMNRQIRLIARPGGLPKPADFETTTTPVPDIDDGQVLVRHLYLALDPAIRNWMDDYEDSYIPPIQLGDVVTAISIGQVVESRHDDFAPGDLTWHIGGWEEYRVLGIDGMRQVRGLTKLAPDPELPLSNYLSICGTTGLTSLFGMLDVGRPALGDTVLVSGAAGAVGSVAGQIAKNVRQCRVVGIAGGAEKCRWITEECGFDVAIDYKDTADMRTAIAAACPNGIDVFFDNVGGDILDAALMNLNFGARVVMCGSISNYGEGVDSSGPKNMWQLLVKNASVAGFTVAHYGDKWDEGTRLLERWRKAGFIQSREEVVSGLDNTLDTFLKLFTGGNRGRLLMKIFDRDDPLD